MKKQKNLPTKQTFKNKGLNKATKTLNTYQFMFGSVKVTTTNKTKKDALKKVGNVITYALQNKTLKIRPKDLIKVEGCKKVTCCKTCSKTK